MNKRSEMKLTVHLTNSNNKFSMKKYTFLKAENKIFLGVEIIRRYRQKKYREWVIKCRMLKEIRKTVKDILDSEQRLLCKGTATLTFTFYNISILPGTI